MLTLYNTLTQKKELFKPIESNKVSIYVCGMTVYDYCHIGHARILIVFDALVRYLKKQGYVVHYVRNITDIDDKIIQRAHRENKPFDAITNDYIQAFHEDTHALGLIPPQSEPRATHYIATMIYWIQTLLKKNYAYLTPEGSVYYDISQFAHYGKLSKQNLAQMRAGVRIHVNEKKDDPLDFALWKASKPNEPCWDSPWGKGRPGWHIECSAMSSHLLGQPFDIHGGGHDLIFPHHENEIAQSEAFAECSFVNTWMHVGFLQINDEKMSKSLGNFLTIREILKEYSAETLRFFILSSHYRSPLNFSKKRLNHARFILNRLYLTLRNLPLDSNPSQSVSDHWLGLFTHAMNDDFNTPPALSILLKLAREVNKQRNQNFHEANALGSLLKTLTESLGLLAHDSNHFLKNQNNPTLSEDNVEKIDQLIQDREQARTLKMWQKADDIRKILADMGILLEDTAEGTLWRRQ